MEPPLKLCPEFDLDRCMACIICLDICPVDCIGLADPQDGHDLHRYPVLQDAAVCTSCGRCADECPVEAVRLVETCFDAGDSGWN